MIEQMLNESAHAVRDAVRNRVEAGRQMDRHYDQPLTWGVRMRRK